MKVKQHNSNQYVSSGVYRMRHNVCPLQYIGHTGRSFRTWFNEQQRYIYICRTHNRHGAYLQEYAGHRGNNTSS
jgi:hypothetical protein